MLRKNWVAPALLAGWLGLGCLTARAQYLPGDPGVQGLAEPAPLGMPSPPPDKFIPGPITPDIAPPGPPDEMSLPAGHSGAFEAEVYPQPLRVQVSLGMMGLDRPQPHGGFIGG